MHMLVIAGASLVALVIFDCFAAVFGHDSRDDFDR